MISEHIWGLFEHILEIEKMFRFEFYAHKVMKKIVRHNASSMPWAYRNSTTSPSAMSMHRWVMHQAAARRLWGVLGWKGEDLLRLHFQHKTTVLGQAQQLNKYQ